MLPNIAPNGAIEPLKLNHSCNYFKSFGKIRRKANRVILTSYLPMRQYVWLAVDPDYFPLSMVRRGMNSHGPIQYKRTTLKRIATKLSENCNEKNYD